MSMGGRAEGFACTDPEVRTPIGMSGNIKSNGLAKGNVYPIYYKRSLILAMAVYYLFVERVI